MEVIDFIDNTRYDSAQLKIFHYKDENWSNQDGCMLFVSSTFGGATLFLNKNQLIQLKDFLAEQINKIK